MSDPTDLGPPDVPALPGSFGQRLRAGLFTVAFVVWTTILCIGWLPYAPFSSGRQMRRLASFWQRGTLSLLRWIVGLRHEVKGLENLPSTPVILASKHQSEWETLFFHTVRPDIVIPLKQELRKVPIFGWYLGIGQNIFLDRAGGSKALRGMIQDARAAIADGCSIFIYPEGTRRPPSAPADYKPGVAALYSGLDVPVVPVALNSARFWRRGQPLGKYPGIVTVEFLEPIPPGLDRKSFMRILEERIETRMAVLEREAARQFEH
ncbi:lysophospholipid acyltransferase family protein [Arboricoccus pini]|nr:lysophospholipid acyltransferase family protein [Arboricoccus pini]